MAKTLTLTNEQHEALLAVIGAFSERVAPEDQYEDLEAKLPGRTAEELHRIWCEAAMAVVAAQNVDDYGREI